MDRRIITRKEAETLSDLCDTFEEEGLDEDAEWLLEIGRIDAEDWLAVDPSIIPVLRQYTQALRAHRRARKGALQEGFLVLGHTDFRLGSTIVRNFSYRWAIPSGVAPRARRMKREVRKLEDLRWERFKKLVDVARARIGVLHVSRISCSGIDLMFYAASDRTRT